MNNASLEICKKTGKDSVNIKVFLCNFKQYSNIVSSYGKVSHNSKNSWCFSIAKHELDVLERDQKIF